MSRPASITAFERLYLASIVLYVVNAALFWSATREVMLQTPQIQANPAMAGMVSGIMIGSLVVSVLLSLLFWWLVARGRNVIGKWLVVVTEAIGAIFGVLALVRLVRGTAPNTPSVAIGLVVTALGVAAAVMLLRSDANAWFGEAEATDEAGSL